MGLGRVGMLARWPAGRDGDADWGGGGRRRRARQSGRGPRRAERKIRGFGFAHHRGGCSSDVSTAVAANAAFPVFILDIDAGGSMRGGGLLRRAMRPARQS